MTGSLAAIWYLNSGSAIALSGTKAGTSTSVVSGGALINQTSTGLEFTAVILDGDTVSDVAYKTSFTSINQVRNTLEMSSIQILRLLAELFQQQILKMQRKNIGLEKLSKHTF